MTNLEQVKNTLDAAWQRAEELTLVLHTAEEKVTRLKETLDAAGFELEGLQGSVFDNTPDPLPVTPSSVETPPAVPEQPKDVLLIHWAERNTGPIAPTDDSDLIVEAPSSGDSGVWVTSDGVLQCVLSTEQKPNRAGKWKSEVYPLEQRFTKWRKPRSEPLGVPMRYSFSVFLKGRDPQGRAVNWAKAGSRILLAQVHGLEDEEEKGFGRNPALALSVETKSGVPCLVWRGSWSSDKIQQDNAHTEVLWTGPVVQDAWLNVSVLATWAYSESGRLLIMHEVKESNGDVTVQTAVDRDGPNTFNDLYGPYWTFGLYLPALSGSSASLIVRPRTYVAEYGDILFQEV